ncbi:MAG TPA: hypothetical protein VEN81_16590, partial [Planctomycetota bacterium]|nr:hypothetical protein [Planctomycetota bacterium]
SLTSSVGNLFGLTDTIAQSIVNAAEPATRKIIAQERTKYAQALIEAVGASSAALLTFIATRYFVPEKSSVLKGVGYGTSALLVGAGALWSLSSLQEAPAPPPPPSTTTPAAQAAAQEAATAVVTAAEPKVRAIVDDERNRLAQAALAGLPFTALGVMSGIGTWILVKDEKKWAKAAGYAAATGLFAVGLWVGLTQEMS